MHPIIGTCPVCGESLEVTRLHCRSCDTAIEGHFNTGAFDRLSPDQLAFAEIFIRCGGRLNAMTDQIGVSYPTLRSRLDELIEDMGGPLGKEEQSPANISEEERRRILEELEAGKLPPEDAVRMLQGG